MSFTKSPPWRNPVAIGISSPSGRGDTAPDNPLDNPLDLYLTYKRLSPSSIQSSEDRRLFRIPHIPALLLSSARVDEIRAIARHHRRRVRKIFAPSGGIVPSSECPPAQTQRRTAGTRGLCAARALCARACRECQDGRRCCRTAGRGACRRPYDGAALALYPSRKRVIIAVGCLV